LGNTKAEDRQVHHYFYDKSYRKYLGSNTMSIFKYNWSSDGTLRLCNSETEIPKQMAHVNESTAEVTNRICYGIPNIRRKGPICIVRKPLV